MSRRELEGCLEAESAAFGQSLSLHVKPLTDWLKPTPLRRTRSFTQSLLI